MSLNMEKINRKKLILILLVFISIVRGLLYFRVPYRILPDQVYDDDLMYKYAFSIAGGKWLGEYNSLTLTKGITYPLFLVICNKLLIPYPLGLAILNVFSSYVFVMAIKKKIKNYYLLSIIYVFILYSPITQTYLTTQRLYRMAIIPSLTVLTFASLIGMFFNLEEKWKTKIGWAVLSGISLFFFYNTREDSIWILPFVCVLSCFMIIFFLAKKTKNMFCYLFVLIPIAFLFLGNTIISSINYKYYGVYTTNDRANLEFGEMMSLLYKIDDENNSKVVWLSKSALDKAINCSPSLQSIENEIHNSMNAWSEDGEVPGDHATWAIRSALDNAGYYEKATKVDEFCKQVVTELELSFEKGELKKREAIYFSSQSRGIESSELSDLFKQSFLRLYQISRYKDCELTNEVNGTGDWASIRLVESYTGALGQYSEKRILYTKGWAFALDNNTTMDAEIVDNNGNIIGQISFYESEDVSNAYPECINAHNSRYDFSREINYTEGTKYYFRVYLDGEIYYEGNLGDYYEDDEIKVFFDDLGISTQMDYNKINDVGVIRFANAINHVYQRLSIIFDVLSVLAFVLLSFVVIKNMLKKDYELLQLWISIMGVFLSAVLLAFGVTTFTGFFGENLKAFIDSFYCSGAYSLMQIFKYLVTFGVVYYILEKRLSSNKEKTLIND